MSEPIGEQPERDDFDKRFDEASDPHVKRKKALEKAKERIELCLKIIREDGVKLKIATEALKFYSTNRAIYGHNDRVGAAVAKEALAEIEKLLGGEG